MTEIREIFKTIQKYFGLFMNNDANSGCSSHSECNEESQSLSELSLIAQDNENYSYLRHTERKRKYPVKISKELSCKKDNYTEINNQLDCFGSKEPHNDDLNFVILSGAKDPLKADTNNAILRGLNSCSPQNDRKNICRLMRGDVGKSKCKVASTFAEGATHVALSNNSCKAAFTLAEVLITLGIIGVVAALTLPTLIQNHQKQVYVTQLKKAYSTLTNAYNQLAVEQGVVDWNQISCSDWYCLKDFSKHINMIKSFEGCEEDWCKAYSICEVDGIQGDTCLGSPSSGFITADGATFIFTCGSYLDPDYSWIIDVNGYNKGPNKPGRDIFQFVVESQISGGYTYNYNNNSYFIGNKLIPVGSKTQYGYQNNTYIGWEPWEDCSATNLTTSCTAKVLIEGKMNY